MIYTFTVSEYNAVLIYLDREHVDTVGPFDSKEGAKLWGGAVCGKYNSPEYANTPYPGELNADAASDSSSS